jgi:phosphoglycerol transferase MdoB-like AlkP superfamily enzyme
LAPLAAFTIITPTVLALVRVGLATWQWDRVAAVERPWRLFTIGLQLDLQLVAYFLALPAVLFVFTTRTSIVGRGAALLTRVWLTLATVLIIFMETATPSFIDEYGIRPNRLFLEYLIYPREVFSMLWAQYKPQLFLAGVLVPLAAWGAWVVFGWSLRRRTGWSLVRCLLVFPLLAALLLLGARSSLGHRPANSSTAAFSSDPLINDLALNSTYSVMDAAYRMKDEKEAGAFYGHMDEEEIVRRVRQAMDAPESAFTDPRPAHPAPPDRQPASRTAL